MTWQSSSIDKLGLTITPHQLVSKVSATAVKNTVLMVVSVTDSNAQHAANIANGYGSILGGYVAKLENLSNDPTVGPLVQIVAKASPESATASGFPTWMALFGALVMGASFAARDHLVPRTFRHQGAVAPPGGGDHRVRRHRQAAQNPSTRLRRQRRRRHSTSARNSSRGHCA